jgi:hypothetical protein
VEVPSVISLRYHIVSLVAVFLALALGIVVGSTVLKEGTVSILRATSQGLRQESERTRTENDALRKELGRQQEFTTTMLPDLVRGKLAGQSVVLLDTDKVDGDLRGKVEEALQAAGADVDARITFSAGRLSLTADADRAALSRLLAADAADPVALRAELAERLAERLATPAALPKADPQRAGDVLTGLDDGNFMADLKLEGSFTDGTTPFPRPGSIFVVIGPADGATLPPEAFLVPLADQVAAHTNNAVAGVEAATAGVTPGTTSWITALRDRREVTRRVSGIDDVDTTYGQFALVQALQNRLQNQPAGQYGVKSGSSGLLPEVPAQ